MGDRPFQRFGGDSSRGGTGGRFIKDLLETYQSPSNNRASANKTKPNTPNSDRPRNFSDISFNNNFSTQRSDVQSRTYSNKPTPFNNNANSITDNVNFNINNQLVATKPSFDDGFDDDADLIAVLDQIETNQSSTFNSNNNYNNNFNNSFNNSNINNFSNNNNFNNNTNQTNFNNSNISFNNNNNLTNNNNLPSPNNTFSSSAFRNTSYSNDKFPSNNSSLISANKSPFNNFITPQNSAKKAAQPKQKSTSPKKPKRKHIDFPDDAMIMDEDGVIGME